MIWGHCFKVLNCNTPGSNVLLTEAAKNSASHREKIYENMFDTFGVGGCYVAVQAILTLYSAGMDSGVVVDSGDGVTHIIPVF